MISALVQQELQALKAYYKTLYFARFLLPSKLKTELNSLEGSTLSERPLLRDYFFLCGSFLHMNWFSKFIVRFFPGLWAFQDSELMKCVRLLEEKEIFSSKYFDVMVTAPCLEEGYQGLSLLHETRGSVDDTKLQERVLGIISVMKLQILPGNKKIIYKGIAKHISPRDFSEAIKFLAENNLIAQSIYDALLESVYPLEFAQAAVMLHQKNLLCLSREKKELPVGESFIDLDSQKAVMKQTILEVINNRIALRTYLPFVQAVILLEEHQMLDTPCLQELIQSSKPEQLAHILVRFKDKLDQNLLPKLEQHRINLESFSHTPERVDSDKFFDLEYCERYAVLSRKRRSQKPPRGDVYLQFFDDMYPRFKQVGQLDVLVNACHALFEQRVFQSQSYEVYRAFLAGVETAQFSDFAAIVILLDADREFVSSETQNLSDILSALKTSPDSSALLTKMQCEQQKPGFQFSRQVIYQLLSQQQPLRSPSKNASPKSSASEERVSEESSDLEMGQGSFSPFSPQRSQDSVSPSWSPLMYASQALGWAASKANQILENMVEPDVESVRSTHTQSGMDSV